LFTGEQLDTETDNYFLRARYYSPNSARFISRDTYDGTAGNPISQNHYLYGGANPLTYVDPSGHFLALVGRMLGSFAMALPRLVSFGRPAIIGGSRALPGGATDVVVGGGRILSPSQMTYILTFIRLAARTATEGGSPDKMPIQVYGTDKFFQHQNHINRAQMGLGSNQSAAAPSFLHRSPKHSRSFTKRNRECGRGRREGNQCDEYPYSTTVEGGKEWADIWVSTMLVTNEEKQGGFVNSFYHGASIGMGDEFLVIPQGATTKYYDKYGIEHRY
jgi:RHS repeat-associated protein